MPTKPSLRNLELFLSVAKTRSFTATAKAEDVSQPALSRHIRLLEDQLGVRLFDRDTRNVTLTPAGEQFLPAAVRLTRDFDLAFLELSQTFSGDRGRVVVGALPSLAAEILPSAIALLHQRRPHIEVSIRDDLSSALLRQLEARELDFALTLQPESSDRLTYRHLRADDWTMVFLRGDRLDVEGPITWSAFEDRPFLAMAPASSVRQLTDSAIEQAGLSVCPLYECAHLATLGGLITQGLGISALPRSALSIFDTSKLAWRPLVDPVISRSLGVVSLKGRSLSSAAEALIGALSDVLDQPPSPR